MDKDMREIIFTLALLDKDGQPFGDIGKNTFLDDNNRRDVRSVVMMFL